MRSLRSLCVVFATFCMTFAAIISADDRNVPPNIVLILADDLGYGEPSCYGNAKVATPHIDSIAASGVRFTDGYVTAATCSPSRAGLMSGQYQQRFGFEFNTRGPDRKGRGIDPEIVTLADVLKSAGYATGLVGKWHLGYEEQFHPQQRGFDEFYGILNGGSSYFGKQRRPSFGLFRGTELIDEPDYLTDVLARESADFIVRHRERPFFLYVPFTAVHKPFTASERYLNRFPDVEDEKQRAYQAMTSALDDGVGRILSALCEVGLEENTLVVFLSDNGAARFHGVGDNGPFRLGKLYLFEGGVRVPFLMRWPGRIEPETVNKRPVSALDLFPTICSAAGAELPDGLRLDGVNLLSWLDESQPGSPHEYLFWRNGPNHAVRKGRWKLIQAGDHVWLFDLNSDPEEVRNLAEEHSDVVRELQQAFDSWQQEMREPGWPSKFGEEQRRDLIDGVWYEVHV